MFDHLEMLSGQKGAFSASARFGKPLGRSVALSAPPYNYMIVRRFSIFMKTGEGMYRRAASAAAAIIICSTVETPTGRLG